MNKRAPDSRRAAVRRFAVVLAVGAIPWTVVMTRGVTQASVAVGFARRGNYVAVPVVALVAVAVARRVLFGE